ncbi:hypothetical protein DL771_006631 [Monosporascus sp. 5C6A]|nr:hypothetical protein DL771_006631 [Monosporascus sp. 5C6A]
MAWPLRRSTEKPPLWPEADDYNNDDDSPPSYEEATGNSGGDPKHVPRKDTDEKMKGPGEKACSHWGASGCTLTLKPRRCCSCADERPWNGSERYATILRPGRGGEAGAELPDMGEKYARTLADARFFGLAGYVRKGKEAAEGFLYGNDRL